MGDTTADYAEFQYIVDMGNLTLEIYIGRTLCNSNGFDGRIDEVAAYQRMLTPERSASTTTRASAPSRPTGSEERRPPTGTPPW